LDFLADFRGLDLISLTDVVERGDFLEDFFKGLVSFKDLRGEARREDFFGDLSFLEGERRDAFFGDLAFLEGDCREDFVGDLAFLEGERLTDDGIFNYS
jgi:hypothetical protein